VVIIVGAAAFVADVLHVNALAYVAMPSPVVVALVRSLRHTRNGW
jgi:hypothetical protein